MSEAPATETITIDGVQYAKFIPFPGSVEDGTLRCIACGQIDEDEIHDSTICPACPDFDPASLSQSSSADEQGV